MNPGDVYPGWLYYRDVVISPATQHDNYQVKVVLDTTNFDYSKCRNDGADIRFCDLYDNQCPYYIYTWNPNGQSVIWVKVPSAGTNKIFLVYGNSGAQSESNINSVFTIVSDLIAGWHFDNQDDTFSLSDVSTNHIDITQCEAQAADSFYGKGLYFDGSIKYVLTDPTALLTFNKDDSFSAAARINVQEWNTDWQVSTIVSNVTTDYNGWMFSVDEGKGNCYIGYYSGGWHLLGFNTQQILDENIWYHVAYVHPSNEPGYFYVNGNKITDYSVIYTDTSPLSYSGAEQVAFGKRGAQKDSPFKGYMDEVFVFGRALTDDEVYTLANNYPLTGIVDNAVTPVRQVPSAISISIGQEHDIGTMVYERNVYLITKSPIDISAANVTAFNVDITDPSNIVRFAFSVDNKTTWYAFNGTTWNEVNIDEPDTLMTLSDVQNLTQAQFKELTSGRQFFNILIYIGGNVVEQTLISKAVMAQTNTPTYTTINTDNTAICSNTTDNQVYCDLLHTIPLNPVIHATYNFKTNTTTGTATIKYLFSDGTNTYRFNTSNSTFEQISYDSSDLAAAFQNANTSDEVNNISIATFYNKFGGNMNVIYVMQLAGNTTVNVLLPTIVGNKDQVILDNIQLQLQQNGSWEVQAIDDINYEVSITDRNKLVFTNLSGVPQLLKLNILV